MGIIDSIKSNAAKSGTNKEKILYIKSDSKVRVRFLQEFDEGFQFNFHDSFAAGVDSICQEELEKTCPLCGDETLRTRPKYAWSVYNYDTKKVEVMLFAVNNCTPVSGLLSMYENYGTIMDRDYVLSKSGKQQNTTYTVIPMDKERFRNAKAKPYTKSAILKILNKAFPLSEEYSEKTNFDDIEEEEDEEDVSVKEKKTRRKNKKSDKKKVLDEEQIEEYLEDNDIDEDDFLEYYEVDDIEELIEEYEEIDKRKLKELINEYVEYIEEEE